MNDRYYDIEAGGITYHLPSVTTILAIADKPGLNEWRARQGFELSEQYSQETADIGREIHNYVARLIRRERIGKLEWGTLSEEIKNGLRAYDRFRIETGFSANDSEVVVFNLKLGYAGTLDCFGVIDKHRVLIDWKTGGRFWPSYYAQLAAYYKALGDAEVKVLYAVNLDRKTGVPIVHRLLVKNCTPYWNYFKSCLSLFKATRIVENLV